MIDFLGSFIVDYDIYNYMQGLISLSLGHTGSKHDPGELVNRTNINLRSTTRYVHGIVTPPFFQFLYYMCHQVKNRPIFVTSMTSSPYSFSGIADAWV